jgi:signal transduction histidine kinase
LRTDSTAARLTRLRWPFRPLLLDVAWGVFSIANLAAILVFSGWETIPFHFIWISFTVLYGFRTWSNRPTAILLTLVMVTTAAGIGLDVYRGTEPPEELTEVPLMAAMFVAMVWHAQRKVAAEREYHLISEENARLLDTQRRFLQDASHQLRTPITIALGHAELLAAGLTGSQQGEDIDVVLGELNKLRSIAERLVVIAAAEDPEFLRLEPVALDLMTMDIIRRWRPAADRNWQLGRLESVVVQADPDRLGLAVDALLENAVRHTAPGDAIRLSAVRGWQGEGRLLVSDTGEGIPPDRLSAIFDRFRTGDGKSRGTGLGLALVRAVAYAHGGQVRVRSTFEEGSEFELRLPGAPRPPTLPAAAPAAEQDSGQPRTQAAVKEANQ